MRLLMQIMHPLVFAQLQTHTRHILVAVYRMFQHQQGQLVQRNFVLQLAQALHHRGLVGRQTLHMLQLPSSETREVLK
jgi:hypothetical protein